MRVNCSSQLTRVVQCGDCHGDTFFRFVLLNCHLIVHFAFYANALRECLIFLTQPRFALLKRGFEELTDSERGQAAVYIALSDNFLPCIGF